MDKAALIASRAMRARDAANLCATSSTIHAEMRGEMCTLRVEEVLAGLEKAMADRGNRIDRDLAAPWDSVTTEQLVADLMGMRRFREAERVLDRSTGWGFDVRRCRQLRIEVHLQSGNTAEGIRLAQECEPVDPRAGLSLALGYLLQGNPLAARAALARTEPGLVDPIGHALVQAMVEHSSGESSAALHTLARTVAALGDPAAVRMYAATVAQVHAWMGDASSALAWLARAVEAGDPRATRAILSLYARPIAGNELWRPLTERAAAHAAAFRMPPPERVHLHWHRL